jgi:hypothetical protein
MGLGWGRSHARPERPFGPTGCRRLLTRRPHRGPARDVYQSHDGERGAGITIATIATTRKNADHSSRCKDRVDCGDWERVASEVNEYGCALTPRLLTPAEAGRIAGSTTWTSTSAPRSTWRVRDPVQPCPQRRSCLEGVQEPPGAQQRLLSGDGLAGGARRWPRGSPHAALRAPAVHVREPLGGLTIFYSSVEDWPDMNFYETVEDSSSVAA